ncbi:MAG: hypothetical protein ACLUOI_32245 [Eisenbergiella sp.]
MCAKVCPIRAIEMRREGKAVYKMKTKWDIRSWTRGFQYAMKVGMCPALARAALMQGASSEETSGRCEAQRI